jgi:hypothetical protein
LVVADESQKFSQNASGEPTAALDAFRAITNRPDDLWRKSQIRHAAEWDRYREMPDGDAKKAELARLRDRQERETHAAEKEPRGKALFLSATPFAYDKNVDYGEGYLFNYGAAGVTESGSRQDGRSFFFVENFGYRIRYHKLTKPEAAVDNGVFEREFHEKMKRDGVLSGRSLDIPTDYDRRFVPTKDAQGQKIDEALEYIRSRIDSTSAGREWGELSDHVRRNFNYLKRMQLLEAIKARAAIPDIKKHIALGRKVVVFHDYNVGGGFNPFTSTETVTPTAKAMTAYQRLLADKP